MLLGLAAHVLKQTIGYQMGVSINLGALDTHRASRIADNHQLPKFALLTAKADNPITDGSSAETVDLFVLRAMQVLQVKAYV